MECHECEPLLDELLRGELPARREAEARSHLAACPSCRAKHMRRLRIAETTPSLTPSPKLERSTQAGRFWRWRRSSSDPPTPGGKARLGLLGRVATAPQVAMGTVMSLIVLVGLWSLPQLTRRRSPRFDGVAAERVHAEHAETEVSAARMPEQLAAELRLPTDEAEPPPQPSAAKDGKGDLEAGLTHFHARDYAAATPLLARALSAAGSDADQARALLYLARSERALGHCDRAVESYTTLVRAHPALSEALPALREGVACYDRLAEPSRAQQLLEQAVSTPALAAGARSLIVQRAAASGRKSAPRR